MNPEERVTGIPTARPGPFMNKILFVGIRTPDRPARSLVTTDYAFPASLFSQWGVESAALKTQYMYGYFELPKFISKVCPVRPVNHRKLCQIVTKSGQTHTRPLFL